MNLSKRIKISQAITPTNGAAAQTAINGATLDMLGWDGVLIVVTTGAITATAVTSINAASGAESDLSDVADLEGTGQSIAVADAEDIFYIDLYRPLERYVRVEVARATADAVISSAVYYQYAGSNVKLPATHGTTINGEQHSSPDEGTA